MAGHLVAKGHAVRVWNRTAEKARRWQARHGGEVVGSPREAAQGSAVTFTCVGTDEDVRAVAYGEQGLIAGLGKGALFVDHTTASDRVARELAVAAGEVGGRFLDAPVSGGQIGAEKGTLTVMCGGEEADFAVLEPMALAYSRSVTLMGPVGSGQLAKMVNQILLANTVQGVAEAVAFAQATGLDTARLFEVLTKGAAWSRPMETRWGPMVEGRFDFGFAVDWMRKDLGICLETARASGTPLPTTAVIDQLYGLAQRAGGGRSDMASLIEVLRKAR
jgi:3-hydroxyisobutyrate dehydrogenase-like beta-hydroxyacid dehydrogenase